MFTNKNDKVEKKLAGFSSSIRARSAIESGDNYTHFQEITSIPKDLRQNFDTIIGKPYHVINYGWPTSGAAFSHIGELQIPYQILINDMVRTPFELSAKYRTKLCLFIQVLGTPQHLGTLLVAATPQGLFTNGNTRSAINSMMCCPHVFMSANESTPVCLEVPFYSNTKLKPTQLIDTVMGYQDAYYASVYFAIINPLAAPASATTSLTVSVTAMWKEAEFYIPFNGRTNFTVQAKVVTKVFDDVAAFGKEIAGDFIDKSRKVLHDYTGFHNPNRPLIDQRMIVSHRNFQNSVDIPTRMEKLDPYANHDRIVNDPVFHSMTDEMLLTNILQKPQYISTFSVSSSTTAGTIVFSRPITPNQEPFTGSTVQYSTSIQQTLAMLSRYWRGTIKIHIQAAMSSFHACRLLVARDYSNRTDALTLSPQMDDMANYMTEILEFSGGGQVQTVDMPFCSIFDELPIQIAPAAIAMSHGVYYIYLESPLVLTGSVPTTVNFNVYLSGGDDLEYYGYAVSNLKVGSLQNSIGFAAEEMEYEEKESKFKAQAATLVNPSSQIGILNDSDIKAEPFCRKFQPIVSVRDHLRRFMQSQIYFLTATSNNGVFSLQVSDLMKWTANRGDTNSAQRIIQQMFLGFSGGLKFKFAFTGLLDAQVRYLPPQIDQTTTKLSSGKSIWAAAETAASVTPWGLDMIYPDYNLFPATTADMNCAPLIERAFEAGQDFSIPVNTEAPADGNRHLGRVYIECVIPQMNNAEFVGDVKNRITATGDYCAVQDLGAFIISVKWRNYNGLTLANQHATLTVSSAYADEARVGFQTIAPPVHPRTSTVGIVEGPYYNIPGTPIDLSTTPATRCYVGIT